MGAFKDTNGVPVAHMSADECFFKTPEKGQQQTW
jgi:hypothetical protein